MKAMHGGNVLEVSRKYGLDPGDIIDFSSSMNDFAIIPEPSEIFTRESIGIYPGDDSLLKEKLAGYSNVEQSMVLPGPGLSYFIYKLADIYSGKRIGIMTPAFSEYSRAFEAYGSRIARFTNDKTDMMKKMAGRKELDLICITRPESPVGNIMEEHEVTGLLEICRENGLNLFIDEAFFDFLEPSKRKLSEYLVKSYSNVILGRSLTKIFSTPSIRAGYLISSSENLQRFSKRMEPWTLGKPVIDFFLKARFEDIPEWVEKMSLERRRLISGIRSLGFEILGNPSANYMTVKSPGGINLLDMDERLKRKGILIRLLEDFEGLGREYFRISVKRRDKNERLLSEIREYMAEAGQR